MSAFFYIIQNKAILNFQDKYCVNSRLVMCVLNFLNNLSLQQELNNVAKKIDHE